jgi:Fe-S cluster biogenesis protein NfuA
MTDLLNTTVACIGLASCPKSSKSSQFSINQQLKAYITEQTDLAQLLIYLIAVDAFH